MKNPKNKTTYEIHRKHRWYLKPCHEFLLLKEFIVDDKLKEITLRFYTEYNLMKNFIPKSKYPNKLIFCHLDGTGQEQGGRIFTGVKYAYNNIHANYSNSGILTIDVILKYKKQKLF